MRSANICLPISFTLCSQHVLARTLSPNHHQDDHDPQIQQNNLTNFETKIDVAVVSKMRCGCRIEDALPFPRKFFEAATIHTIASRISAPSWVCALINYASRMMMGLRCERQTNLRALSKSLATRNGF